MYKTSSYRPTIRSAVNSACALLGRCFPHPSGQLAVAIEQHQAIGDFMRSTDWYEESGAVVDDDVARSADCRSYARPAAQGGLYRHVRLALEFGGKDHDIRRHVHIRRVQPLTQELDPATRARLRELL